MALRKTTIPVDFPGGLDQKTIDKRVMPGQFVRLENAVRRKKGLVQKRNGYTQLGDDIISSADVVSEGKRLHTFNNDLVLLNNTTIYSYSSSNDAWSDRGFVTSTNVSSAAITRNSDSQAMIDTCHLGGLSAYVYEDSRNDGVRLTIVDDASGSAIVYDRELAQSASYPKVNCTDTHIVVTYMRAGNFEAVPIAKTDPETIPVATVLQNDAADAPHDLDRYNTGLAFAYNTNTGDIKIGYLTGSGELGSVGNGFLSPVTDVTREADGALTVVVDQPRGIINVLGYETALSQIFMLSYTADLNTSGSTTIESSGSYINLTGYVEADGTVSVYYDRGLANSTLGGSSEIRYRTIFWDLSIFTTSGVLNRFYNVTLGAKVFADNGTRYILAAFETALQPAYYLLDEDGNVVSRILSQIGGGQIKDVNGNLKGGLAKIELNSAGKYFTGLQVRNQLRALQNDEDTTVLSSYKGVQQVQICFDSSPFDGDQLGQNLHIAGGAVLGYDGVRATELGFSYFPENLTTGAVPAGSLPAGNYSFRVLYEWVDGRGQIHRSAPSTQINFTANGSEDFNIIVPTLQLTSKSDVKVVVYATKTNDTEVFYRAAETDSIASANNVSIDITAAVTGNEEILYTVGGTLENIAPPAANVVHKHKNRLWLGGLEDEQTLWYSREHVTGEGVFFSDFLTAKVDSLGGAVTAMDTLDDKLVIFKKDATFVLAGDGPTDNGTLNDFSIPELVSGDIGCVDPRTIARVPAGLMFKSEKGIYLLTRTLDFVYVGDRVEDFNGLTLTSAVLIDELNEVRFTSEEGTALVYNYYFNQWSTFTNHAAVSAVLALGSMKHLQADGKVQSVDASFDDNGTRIAMAVETGWFSFGASAANWYAQNGPMGFQRVYRLGFLGEFFAHHIMKMQLAYDYEDGYTDTVYYATDGNIASELYGDDALYGDSEVYGGQQGAVLQWRHKPTRQKCGAIKVRLEDIDTVGEESSAAFGFVSMSFEIGVKSGINRFGANRTIGNG